MVILYREDFRTGVVDLLEVRIRPPSEPRPTEQRVARADLTIDARSSSARVEPAWPGPRRARVRRYRV